MSINKLIASCALLLLAMTSNVMAITVEEMSVNNNKAIELDQNIMLAKKAAELANLKAASAPEPSPATRPIFHASKAEKKDVELYVESVHGDVGNPTVTFLIDGAHIAKTQNEEVVNGWIIASIGPKVVLLVKHTPKKPDAHKALNIGQTPSPVVSAPPELPPIGTGQGVIPIVPITRGK